jgi:nicotinic acetylcholine receptor, invertebrate
MIYKSYCAINIEYYPFDIQDCYMKFGTWTFNGDLIDLEHIKMNDSIPEKNAVIRKGGLSTKLYTVEYGIDMSDYYQSVEWDVLSVPAQKNIKYYDCCAEPYYDIYFNITIRRKTLFYTVNMIIPCVNISFLSVLVFYLPSDSGEKLTLGISILVALLVFYLLLIELIPPTSLVIPLLGKYLLFTLILVNLSILLTIFILNLHHRKPTTHKMPYWMRRVFIDILPRMLKIERPNAEKNAMTSNYKRMDSLSNTLRSSISIDYSNRNSISYPKVSLLKDESSYRDSFYNHITNSKYEKSNYPLSISKALNGIGYINKRMRKENDDRTVCILFII